jgi:hypothetical protein
MYQVNIQIPSNAPVGDNLLLWLINPDGSLNSNRQRSQFNDPDAQ